MSDFFVKLFNSYDFPEIHPKKTCFSEFKKTCFSEFKKTCFAQFRQLLQQSLKRGSLR